ncbi:DUF4232 domain-containing protein [Streptomyces sp. NPDC003016]
MGVRRAGAASVLAFTGALVLAGCAGVLVPDGEGEPEPTPTAKPAPAHSATPSAPSSPGPSSPGPSSHGPAARGPEEWPPVASAPPASPAGTPPGRCSSGRPEVSMGEVQAALGHRAVGLTLTNCGEEPHQVYGYPTVQALGTDGKVLDIWVNRGSSYMGQDKGPASVILDPGESVRSLLSWTSNPSAGRLRQAAALAIAAAPGEKARKFPLEGEMRTVDELTLTAWRTGPAG